MLVDMGTQLSGAVIVKYQKTDLMHITIATEKSFQNLMIAHGLVLASVFSMTLLKRCGAFTCAQIC